MTDMVEVGGEEGERIKRATLLISVLCKRHRLGCQVADLSVYR